MIIQGDSLEELKKLDENSVDAIVTDPPYGLSFMGKKWDYDVPSVGLWKEAIRVLKPGGYLLSFAGTRTYHRMAVNIEDAGFEIRDTIGWVFASGFPKSLNISKNMEQQIDKFISENDLDLIWEKQTIKLLEIVNGVKNQSEKNQIEIGTNIEKRNSVVENVLENLQNEEELLGVKIVTNLSSEVNPISKDTLIVLQDVGLNTVMLKQNVKFVIKELQKEEVKLKNQNIYIVDVDVKELLNEKMVEIIKAEGLRGIWLGRMLSSKKGNINASCVEIINDLKHIILNQLKISQNLDIKYLMENVSATNVIITKSTMECLISFTVDILKREIKNYEREIIGVSSNEKDFRDVGKKVKEEIGIDKLSFGTIENAERKDLDITKGNSEWEGYGTALKPAWESICVARKPLSEKNVALNVLKWGTGGINIDATRIGSVKPFNAPAGNSGNEPVPIMKSSDESYKGKIVEGRFPANIILECICDELKEGTASGSPGHWAKTKVTGFGEFGNGKSEYHGVGEKDKMKCVIHTNPNCPCKMLDEQSGVSSSSKLMKLPKGHAFASETYGHTTDSNGESIRGHNDKGGASRFFYCAKSSKAERNLGCDDLDEKKAGRNQSSFDGGKILTGSGNERNNLLKNNHPTVKPIKLMEYLVKLVSKEGATVLDPFTGSGTTGIACIKLNRKFIGIEMEEEYVKIAEARIKEYSKQEKLL